jgi:hypothetical protein
LGGRGRQISEFKASLIYRVSSRTARATQRNPVSKKTKKQNKQNQKKKKKKKNNSNFLLNTIQYGNKLSRSVFAFVFVFEQDPGFNPHNYKIIRK